MATSGTKWGAEDNYYWRIYTTYSTSEDNHSRTVTVNLYLHWRRHVKIDMSGITASLTQGSTTKTFKPTGIEEHDGGYDKKLGSITKTFTKGTSVTTKTITAKIKKTGSSNSKLNGSSTLDLNFTIGKRKHTVKFYVDNNLVKTDTVTYGTKYLVNVQAPRKEGMVFDTWDYPTMQYHIPNGTYLTVDQDFQFVAHYYEVQVTPPTLSVGTPIYYDRNNTPKPQGVISSSKVTGTNVQNNWYSYVYIPISDIEYDTGASGNGVASIVTSVKHYASNGNVITKTDYPCQYGQNGERFIVITLVDIADPNISIAITDNKGKSTTYTVWLNLRQAEHRLTIKVNNRPPNLTLRGYGNFKLTNQKTNTVIKGDYPIRVTSDGWEFDLRLTDDDLVSGGNFQYKIEYSRADTDSPEGRKAFFSTTRNANFSTGITNTMFVSGSEKANYSSRVWWSRVNNPLYFPDTNYVEVGSNDTAVMGLCKVGDYLGAVKQSKTTDTAIFLIFPTSFEDNTTFAVRQGVQGIGALGKYTFNVLGDETLFLSPNGVMAIVLGEDEEHKVQNRSFYVDGKLLKEGMLENAYSFVFEGKYYLALGDGCYVLDGNQRNSWGNDRTNLVYECYYMDNIPAKCFMKYHDELWFSDDEGIYRVKNYYDEDVFVDEKIVDGEVEKTNVVAEWSTVFDDDGSLQYFKNTVKKASVISLLAQGEEESQIDIYARKDKDEPVLLGTATIDNETPIEFYPRKKFKKYKRLQFILRCTNGGFGISSITKLFTFGNYSKNK